MGFQSKNLNWEEVTPAGTSTLLPAGGYVAVITKVEDDEKKEYLRFTFDIAEGEHQAFFATDDRVYTHQFIRSYKEKAIGFMKQFLDCVEESNDDFKQAGWDSNPDDLLGKKVGIVVQHEMYVNGEGAERTRANVEAYASADDIRNGRYKKLEAKDSREASTPQQQQMGESGSVYHGDIPFD